MKKQKANYLIILEKNEKNFQAIDDLSDKVDVNIVDTSAFRNSITTFKGSLDTKQKLDDTNYLLSIRIGEHDDSGRFFSSVFG